ncbi:hypothetical protein AD006_31210 (plasmid) [Pseudonocardia sp. EC080610-09]|uniref:PadR family transcriptional regulator n=2 Tax=unclassified Pseudonocardia TaxID=2619320 RepID=UPI000705DAB3|nr:MULTISPECIES: PadR family transcriptional regulator [unclassified Pseudonocardia]ALL79876.1 hypothetical protein AD006_31210 [Pseudonocardia sp. EC080610-09]ALL85746.1 hypothetical protein AD017_30025 [Pseudonocardia sp. EC080619-01]
MSLRHALLALLTADPMTGYELVKYFDGTTANVWSAPHSQIYPELRRMEADGLIDVREIPRGERATKREYVVNANGVAEFKKWLDEPAVYQSERDVHRLRASHLELSSYESARRQLGAHLNHYSKRLTDAQLFVADIEERRVPLLRKRLERRPEAEHEAIVAYKLFAYRGQVRKAETEIAWAREGLELIDDLERRQIPLYGEAFDGYREPTELF